MNTSILWVLTSFILAEFFLRKMMLWFPSHSLYTYDFSPLRFLVTVYQATRCHISETTIFFLAKNLALRSSHFALN